MADICFEDPANCPDNISACITRTASTCKGTIWSSRYDNASAAWVVQCAILMFFMKAGFLFLEISFSKSFRKRVVLVKYVDIFAGTFGFWLFGYALSGNTDVPWLGEEQDYIFWFFRFTFATNTATILGGTLVGEKIQLRLVSVFLYSFTMTALIHPFLARLFWAVSAEKAFSFSPYVYCNGTFILTRNHSFVSLSNPPDRDFIFIDFAGSGLVHLCGGTGAFVLAVFQRIERERRDNSKVVINEEGTNDSDNKPVHTQTTTNSQTSPNDTEEQPTANSTTPVTNGGGMGNITPAPDHDDAGDHSSTTPVTNGGGMGDITPAPDHDDAGDHSSTVSSSPNVQCDKKKTLPSKKSIIFVDWMYPEGEEEHVEYGALGIIILWTTWFAFNAGSTESISGKDKHAAVGRIALVMSLACASAGIVQTLVSWAVMFHKKHQHLNVNEIANAVLGGLVAVTGCCPFIEPYYAVVIGVITVIWYHCGCYIVYRCHLHDSARVFPVHAMCGFWGVVCVGIFSKGCLIREVYNFCFCAQSSLPAKIDNSHLELIAYQLVGAFIIIVWSLILSAILFLLLYSCPLISMAIPRYSLNKGKDC